MIITDGHRLASDLSVDELHEFAAKIDLPPRWFHEGERETRKSRQDKKVPYYDLLGTKMEWAFREGAELVTAQEFWQRAVRA